MSQYHDWENSSGRDVSRSGIEIERHTNVETHLASWVKKCLPISVALFEVVITC
jgi:hypothetical protein